MHSLEQSYRFVNYFKQLGILWNIRVTIFGYFIEIVWEIIFSNDLPLFKTNLYYEGDEYGCS